MQIITQVMATALLCLASNAMASNWVTVYSGTEATLQYETESLRKDGSNVLVWERLMYRTIQNETGLPPFNEARERLDIDCAHSTANVSTMANYLNGALAGSQKLSIPPDDISPDSPISVVEKAVCK